MESTVLEVVLNLIGYAHGDSSTASNWIRPLELTCIMTDTDGKEYYSWRNEKVCFDTDNKIILIKRSALTPISSRFSKWSFSDSTHLVARCDGLGNPYSTNRDLRKPKAGDRIRMAALYSHTDLGVARESEIASVSYDKTSDSYTMVLSDADAYKTGADLDSNEPFIILESGTNGVEAPLSDQTMVFIAVDQTDNAADSFITMDEHFVGLDFNRNQADFLL